jgi:hypothetical protein
VGGGGEEESWGWRPAGEGQELGIWGKRGGIRW